MQLKVCLHFSIKGTNEEEEEEEEEGTYCALVRAAIDYGRMVYCSSAKTLLVNLEVLQ